jgi:hypothetical protein
MKNMRLIYGTPRLAVNDENDKTDGRKYGLHTDSAGLAKTKPKSLFTVYSAV